MTFAAIQDRAAKLEVDLCAKNLGYRVDALIDSARCNADDTVYGEKTVDLSRYDEIARSSLELLLGCCKDKPVMAWFRRAGFSW